MMGNHSAIAAIRVRIMRLREGLLFKQADPRTTMMRMLKHATGWGSSALVGTIFLASFGAQAAAPLSSLASYKAQPA
jgi:hypothetical protein